MPSDLGKSEAKVRQISRRYVLPSLLVLFATAFFLISRSGALNHAHGLVRGSVKEFKFSASPLVKQRPIAQVITSLISKEMYGLPRSDQFFNWSSIPLADFRCPEIGSQLQCKCEATCKSDKTCAQELDHLCRIELADRCVSYDVETHIMQAHAKDGLVGSIDLVQQAKDSNLKAGKRLLVIAGEQKCGSTNIFELLTKHPSLRRPLVHGPLKTDKEVHFWEKHHRVAQCNIKRGLYNLFPDIKDHQFAVDATPDYLCDPVVARLMLTIFPHAKIIVLLRDPILRAHSAWNQNFRAGWETRTFVKAMRDELSIAQHCASIAELWWVRHFSAVRGSRNFELDSLEKLYSQQCAHFFGGRPRDCWTFTTGWEQLPACKRYLIKGFSAFHVAVWQRYAKPEQFKAYKSEALFEGEFKPNAFFNDFLGIPSSPKLTERTNDTNSTKEECWHHCDVTKTKFEDDIPVGGQLHQDLKKLFCPWVTRAQNLSGFIWAGWEDCWSSAV